MKEFHIIYEIRSYFITFQHLLRFKDVSSLLHTVLVDTSPEDNQVSCEVIV